MLRQRWLILNQFNQELDWPASVIQQCNSVLDFDWLFIITQTLYHNSHLLEAASRPGVPWAADRTVKVFGVSGVRVTCRKFSWWDHWFGSKTAWWRAGSGWSLWVSADGGEKLTLAEQNKSVSTQKKSMNWSHTSTVQPGRMLRWKSCVSERDRVSKPGFFGGGYEDVGAQKARFTPQEWIVGNKGL